MQDLTKGPITGHLLKTTSFMLVTMLFQTLYFLVDLYWVGHIGTDAVAAVALAGNITFVVLAMTQVLGVGTTTLVSHAAGRKDHEYGLLVFNQSQVLSMLFGVAVLIIGMLTRHSYAMSMSADSGTAKLAEDYLLWFIPAMGLQFAMVAMGSALRGLGNFKPGMVVSTTTVVLNMILAPILMFGWGTGHPMGVAGAALSTLVSVVVGVLWLTSYFLKKDSFLTFTVRDWAPNLKIWGKMLGIGLPSGFEFALMAVYLFLVYSVIKPFGAEAQAGFGIGQRVVQALFMPVVALGFAVAPVAGQNFGAKLGDRVKATYKDAALMALALMTLFALLCHIAPGAMIGIFSDDPRVIDVGTTFLKIVSWNFMASGLIFVNSSMFQAMGNTLPSLVTSATRILAVGVPVVWLSRQPGFQLQWIWYLSVASVVLQLALSEWLLYREFGRKLALTANTAGVPTPNM
ncbi:MAG: MATE family efflux transporter [Acidobacteria bacterium]|nr:MAG: MATE family efflux transporter [Acidobacteriota bacterium]